MTEQPQPADQPVRLYPDRPELPLSHSFGSVPAPDASAAARARERQDQLTKPTGSLGRLEEVSVWLASVQAACPPRPLEQVRCVVVAGDHGIAQAGVSAYPPEVTAQMVAGFVEGHAAVNVLARLAGAEVEVLDVSVARGVPAGLDTYKVNFGSARIDEHDALSADDLTRAIDAGRDLGDRLADAGTDLVIFGDMGIGNTTPAAALVGALTLSEPVDVIGRGTGIDDDTWMRKAAALRDAMYRARMHVGDPLAILRTVAGADLAFTTGALVQCSLRRTPVLLDGVVPSACALAAEQLAPGASRWWLAATRSTEAAQEIALARLGLEPLLDLGLRLGEGSGALLALPLVHAAGAILREMATFAEAGVSGPQTGNDVEPQPALLDTT